MFSDPYFVHYIDREGNNRRAVVHEIETCKEGGAKYVIDPNHFEIESNQISPSFLELGLEPYSGFEFKHSIAFYAYDLPEDFQKLYNKVQTLLS